MNRNDLALKMFEILVARNAVKLSADNNPIDSCERLSYLAFTLADSFLELPSNNVNNENIDCQSLVIDYLISKYKQSKIDAVKAFKILFSAGLKESLDFINGEIQPIVDCDDLSLKKTAVTWNANCQIKFYDNDFKIKCKTLKF